MSDQLINDSVCPFCQSGIRSSIYLESEHFLALYNRAPVLPGHSLIITRAHRESLLELTSDELEALMPFIVRITKALLAAYDAAAFDITLQDGRPAGQTVDHFHLHVLPRVERDLPEPGDWFRAVTGQTVPEPGSSQRPILAEADIRMIVDKLRMMFTAPVEARCTTGQ